MKPIAVKTGGLMILLMIISGLIGAGIMPAGSELPVHWSLDGTADRFMNKWAAIFLMPMIATGILALLAFLPLIEPRKDHLLRSQGALNTIVLAAIGLMLLVHCLMLAEGLGHALDVPRLLTAGIGVLLILIGNVFGKIRSTFFLGTRTPWTLSSERSWAKTHRLGGFLFVALGVSLLIGVIAGLSPATLISWLLTGIFSVVIGLIVYSYFVWRSDPGVQA